MTDSSRKKACLVYVQASSAAREDVRAQLSAKGYDVCEVQADVEDAHNLQDGAPDLPAHLLSCLKEAEICVILLPEDPSADGLIGAAAACADAYGRPIVCVSAGGRSTYPEAIDDHARSVVRVGSSKLGIALAGAEIWEAPDGGERAERDFKTVKCQ